ncbi:uncharacterized protein LACBIDRAFT_298543 [Laccaria bicolor S238N-H82]|uniref:Predicted protein n=1 Tax=Laccaria bicolor (strain S238N-H82 / ATCC MYA-4686) TaxID=486041 RepID=B0DD28_LACBS|nr:uncharacterized protein LACBIDRAFT_298543 [Laccaria bicolor S238N-H82]EDR07542.1 predicted protein [Laccaria bicolor S238N-H82]|eukprot:XP_001881934.1 predicted protein [Laccaria bicolor S238N-H82]
MARTKKAENGDGAKPCGGGGSQPSGSSTNSANQKAHRAQEAFRRQAVLSKLQFNKIKKPDTVGTTTVDPPVLAQSSRAVSVAADPNTETPITVEVRDMEVDGVPSLAIGGDAQVPVSSSGVVVNSSPQKAQGPPACQVVDLAKPQFKKSQNSRAVGDTTLAQNSRAVSVSGASNSKAALSLSTKARDMDVVLSSGIGGEGQASVASTRAGATNRSKEAERTPMREEVMAKRRFRKHGDRQPSQDSRDSGRAANGNPRKPVLTAGARDMKVVSLGGEVRTSVPSASVVTNQPGKMNEVPTHKEVLAKLRFNKHKNSGDQPPSQNSRAVGGTVDSNSRGSMLGCVNAQRDPPTLSIGGSLSLKSQNPESVVGHMDKAHLGRPLSPVNVHGRSNPSQSVSSSNEPRNPPHTDKAVHVNSQPFVSRAVKLERMQVLDSGLHRNDAQTSVDTVSFSADFPPKKRPRKQKGAPPDDVALAKLRPRHSHNLGDIGGRDVIMSTEEETYVGSHGSQTVTGKAIVGHQQWQNSNVGQINDKNSKMPNFENANTPDVDRPPKEKMRTAKLKGAKPNLVLAVVEGGVLRQKEPEALQLVSPLPQLEPSTATQSTIAKKERKGKDRAPAESMVQMDEQPATSFTAENFFPQREPTSSMAPIIPPLAEGSSSVETRHPRKAKEPAAGEPKAKRVKLSAATTSSVVSAFVHETYQPIVPAPVQDATTTSVGALQVPPYGGAKSVKTKGKAKEPPTGGPINGGQLDTAATTGLYFVYENALASASAPANDVSMGSADLPCSSSTAIAGHDSAQAGEKPRRRKAKEPASGEPKAKRTKRDPPTTQEGLSGTTESTQEASASSGKRGRPKKQKDPAESTTVKAPGQKRAKKAKENEVASKPKALPIPTPNPPTWKLVPVLKPKVKQAKPTATDGQTKKPKPTGTAAPKFTPRIWSSSKEEFLTVMPELTGTKCVNGVSWLCSQNPYILLEEAGKYFGVSAADGKRVLELTTTRDFVCATEQLLQEVATTESTSHSQPTLAESMWQIEGGSRAISVLDPAPNATTASKTTKDSLVGAGPLADIPAECANSFNADLGTTIPPSLAPATHPSKDVAPLLKDVDLALSPSCARNYNHLDCKNGIPVNSIPESKRGPLSPIFIPKAKVTVFYDDGSVHSSQTPEPFGKDFGTYRLISGQPLSPETDSRLNSPPGPSLGSTTLCSPPTPSSVPMASLERPPNPLMLNNVVEDHQRQAISLPISDHPPTSPDLPAERPTVSTPEKQPQQSAGRVPSSLPEELQTLVDAYIHSLPVTVIAARSCVLDIWPNVSLAEEFALAFLGYFKVLGVKEVPIKANQPKSLASGMSAGRVEWSFKLEWVAGGEEWLVAPTDNNIDYSRPWWDPEPTKAPEAPAQSTPQPELTLDETTTQMQQLELSPNETPSDPLVDPNDDWQSRYQVEKMSYSIWDRLGDIYYSQISSHFVAAFGCTHIVPSGWYCVQCGKLNFQAMFRHRRCSSSVCKATALPPGFALDLSVIRNLHDAQPLPLPYNTFPEGVQARVASWSDGVRTLTYTLDGLQKRVKLELKSESPAGAAVPMIKHVFTCNMPSLQVAATQLFMDIQSSVVLSRTVEDGNAIFMYSCPMAPSPESKAKQGKGKKSCVKSPKQQPLPCLVQAKDLLISKASAYAEVDSSLLGVDHLDVMAWATSGSQRGIYTASATKKTVMMICLGCEVVLTLSPKGKAPQVVRKKTKLPKVTEKSKEGKTTGKQRRGKAKAKDQDPHLPTDAQPSAPADSSSVIGPVTQGIQMLDLDSLLTMEDDEEDIKPWPAPVASTSSIVPLFQSIGPFSFWPNPVAASTPSAMMAPTSSFASITPAPVPESALLPDLDSLIRMDDGEDHHQDNHTADVEMRDAEVPEPTTLPQLDPDVEEDEGPDKPDTDNVVVTLVHGDVLVLSGAEFQYSIKRTGTSVLLIGTCYSSAATTDNLKKVF